MARGDEQLSDALLEYLAEHPEGMDTLEGVAEWWVMRHRIRVEIDAVARALEDLVIRGALEEVEAGGQRRYRLRRPS